MKPLIKLIITDVDGVLTDGNILVQDGSMEGKLFYVRDGYIMKQLGHLGILQAVISGRYSKATDVRMNELGFDPELVIQGVGDKYSSFLEIINKLGITPEETAYIGDDVIDYVVLEKCGFSGVPYDASDTVKGIADYICKSNGGRGAYREFAEEIIKRNGKWQEFLSLFS